ncbi:pyruvate oxidase [Melghirimyces thermohalophilus]|uniref:Pyruvate oxidase n=1 Tax=Melghirimyces thermohalophilus TaxID=1236220 RepID=A0A1G6I625_9BACL|nr:pyruvate oxidase [Melghirimyces thermohalophilus]SDC01982.1 pyruvate oxidase [Melghirimyces thermohalophilus]
MSKKAGDALMDILVEEGVEYIFGMPGDSINSLIESLRNHPKIKFIQVRHEEAGALAAAAYAKLTGKLGVCMAIAGPGAIHLLNGLYDAKMDSAPVLAITGQVESDMIGTNFFQEVDLDRLFDDVAIYNERAMSAEQLPVITNQAIRMAQTHRRVAHISIPDDIPRFEVERHARMNSTLFTPSKPTPRESDVDKAVSLLSEPRKTIILAGQGARDAREELLTFAQKLKAPIVVTLPGKGVVPDDHPYCLGGLGLLGTKPAFYAMREAETLVMIGTSFPFIDFLPREARTIHIDANPAQIGKRTPVDVGVAGDAAHTLQMMNKRLSEKQDDHYLTKYQREMKNWLTLMKEQGEEEGTPLRPQTVPVCLQDVLDNNAIISCDVGNVTVWMARNFILRDQKFIVSSWLATLGCGLPGAIAGQLAYPDRQVVAVVGDGGFAMMMSDFVTAVKYDLPIVVIVLNNDKIAMIKFEQESMGNAEFGTNLTNPNFARYAEDCGGVGIRVENRDELKDALDRAFQVKKPVIVDVLVDPNEAPLPARITLAQAKNYAIHLVKEWLAERRKSDEETEDSGKQEPVQS